MSSCNVRNRNVHIVNSVGHHTKPLSAGKSDCSCNVSKPVICGSIVVNLSKHARKQSFNVSIHKHGVNRALARKLKMMAFPQNWEIRLVFTKGCHHGWRQDIVLLQLLEC